MRQPLVIIWPLISPSSAAPSAMSGKSESSTDFSLTSAALIFRRLARSFRAFSTAESLLMAIRDSNVPPGFFVPAIHFEPEIGYGQLLTGDLRSDFVVALLPRSPPSLHARYVRRVLPHEIRVPVRFRSLHQPNHLPIRLTRLLNLSTVNFPT